MERSGKKWGIYNLIMLSLQDVPINVALIFIFLGFWATSINGFIFPFATMSPTFLDVIASIGLLIEGEELSTLFSLLVGDLGKQLPKFEVLYLAFLATNAKNKGFVSDSEHHTFLLY